MANCKKCKHAIFDEVWGDYKCRIKYLVIYDPKDVEHCVYYDKGKPTISENNKYEKEVDE